MESFCTHLKTLHSLLQAYQSPSPSEQPHLSPTYTIEGFVNEEAEPYKSYARIEQEFETVGRMYEEIKRGIEGGEGVEGRISVEGNEEYLRLENRLLKERIKKQEGRLQALRGKLHEVVRVAIGRAEPGNSTQGGARSPIPKTHPSPKQGRFCK